MRKGFTLLELIIVIIIVGILATLGFTQYSAVIEKSRGAEARQTIGLVRSQIAAKTFESFAAGTGGTLSAASLGIIGTGGGIPLACVATNYFSYTVDGSCSTVLCTITATRCTSGGKNPQGPSAGTLQLIFTSGGTDTWSSSAGY